MNDLISKQDAIDLLTSAVERCKGIYGDLGGAVSGAREFIKAMPSIEPERRKGKWIFHLDDLFPEESTQECSVCHEEESIKIQNDNFCPYCGAKMEGNDIRKSN